MKLIKILKQLLKKIFSNEGGINQLTHQESIEHRKHEMLLKHYHQYPFSI